MIGDIGLAAWKANSRNAHLWVYVSLFADGSLEAYLTIRGQEYLASVGQAPSSITTAVDGVPPQDVRLAFAPGAGMNGVDVAEPAAIAPAANPPSKKWGRSKATPAASAPALPARQ